MKGKRTSKYKSIIGEEQKNKFTNINLVSEVSEGKLIACNGSFIAASWNSTAGSVAVFNTNFPSNIKFNCPVLKGHKNSVFDLEFSPLKDTLLATASDDATVKLWEIPPEGLTQNLSGDLLTYKGHTRRVSFVKFNPVAADVIASASTDYTLQVWNAVKGELYSQVEFGDLPTSLDWNPIGSLVGVTNKKKMINIFDPREKKSTSVFQIYESPRSPKFTWVGENTFVTTGFSKQNVKELKLWDIRKVEEDLKSKGPVQKIVIDNLLTVATPFYDHESKLLFTSGKGELSIHCYDLNDSIIYQNPDYKSKTPALSLNMFERRVLDYNKCEIDRFLHYNSKKELSFISFYIARKNPEYEPELYPPVAISEAALTCEQWISGENKEPIKKQIHLLENKYISKPENFNQKGENNGIANNELLDNTTSNQIKIVEDKVNNKQKIYDNLLKEKEDLEKKLNELRKKKEEVNDKLNSALKLKAQKDEGKKIEEIKNEENLLESSNKQKDIKIKNEEKNDKEKEEELKKEEETKNEIEEKIIIKNKDEEKKIIMEEETKEKEMIENNKIKEIKEEKNLEIKEENKVQEINEENKVQEINDDNKVQEINDDNIRNENNEENINEVAIKQVIVEKENIEEKKEE